MQKCYTYKNDGFFAGEQIAYRRLPGNATFVAPPPRPWVNLWPKWVNGEWQMVEDHRERPAHLFPDDAQEATEFWLPEDDWQSQPRKMTTPGPLPDGALLERPERPESEKLQEAKAQKLYEIRQGYDAAMAASLTMPAENPSAADVAVGAALFAAEDAEGLEYVSQAHASKYAALVRAVEDATSVDEVEAVKVGYAV